MDTEPESKIITCELKMFINLYADHKKVWSSRIDNYVVLTLPRDFNLVKVVVLRKAKELLLLLLFFTTLFKDLCTAWMNI